VDHEVKPYLDYPDKEMTIMGILSAFCVGTSALVAREVLIIGDAATLITLRTTGAARRPWW
jgi:hypothetical protein